VIPIMEEGALAGRERGPRQPYITRVLDQALKNNKSSRFYQHRFSWQVFSAVSYFYGCSELVGTDL